MRTFFIRHWRRTTTTAFLVAVATVATDRQRTKNHPSRNQATGHWRAVRSYNSGWEGLQSRGQYGATPGFQPQAQPTLQQHQEAQQAGADAQERWQHATQADLSAMGVQ